MPKLYTFETRDQAAIRDGILRVLSNGLPGANVTPGSDWYVFAHGVAGQLEVVEANALIKSDAQMPDSAEDEDLYRICAIFGLSLQPAAGSTGQGILSSTATTTIPSGAELINSVGLRYRLVNGGTFDDGELLTLESVDTGKATNLDEGDVLRWQTAPPFADEKVLVGVGGLVNGHDAESDEGLRARLYARLQNPPRSGDWQHVAEIAEQSTPAVVKAFVYPALQGPGTVHVAVVAAPTATSKNRDVNATTMSTSVVPYVQGQLPEHVHIVTTTVANTPAWVALALSIPEASTASPPGPGGGWLDGTPWPDVGVDGIGTIVSVVTSTTQLTVNAVAAPIAGVSRVSYLSNDDWVVRTARVLTVGGTSGAWVITLDSPLTGISPADYLFPACVNAQAYVDTLLDSFAAMGPGEKTDNAAALIRGFRRPRPETAWPYALGPQMLRELIHPHAEIAYAAFINRSDGTVGVEGPSGLFVPNIPEDVTDPPNIFVPFRIAFFRAT